MGLPLQLRLRLAKNKMETTIVYWGYIGIMEKWKLLYIMGFYWVYRVNSLNSLKGVFRGVYIGFSLGSKLLKKG